MLRAPQPASIIANVRRAWRRSLQIRVVTITLAAAGALVLTFGLVVGGLITNGLVDAKTRSAEQIVDANTDSAWQQIKQVGPSDPLAANKIGVALSTATGGDDTLTVLLVPDSPDEIKGLARVDLPAQLTQSVTTMKNLEQRSYLDLSQAGRPGNQLYLIFGVQLKLSWGDPQLYYFFPLEDVVQQADQVGNTIAVTGVLLVLMLGLVVFFVTRLVVRPVRVAARTAQRLSNGLLDQRMEVTGEDDLAALAASFNQMAENLQRHILRLEEMSRLQRRFTSDVSHELRTPLTTVRMAADLIFNIREELDPIVSRSAELLQAELDRFEGLLAELLEISRFDAGFAALDAEPANLGPLVERAVERLRPVAERAGLTVEVDLPTEPVVAEVDVRRVERILRNLIGNAIEHGEGRPVLVRLAAREGTVAITVRDHGIGLKAGDEKLVFNRFWRADPSRARQTGGTGLGLSISAEDARLHGGWLEAWGAPGQGAQFRLTVPARAGDRLVSSPLRLVPTDFKPPTDAEPEEWSAGSPASDGPGRPFVRVTVEPLVPLVPELAPVREPARAGLTRPAGTEPAGSSTRMAATAARLARSARAARSTLAGRGPGTGATPGTATPDSPSTSEVDSQATKGKSIPAARTKPAGRTDPETTSAPVSVPSAKGGDDA
jgi:two-component system sensor histidine kinase MtrB